jgi:hypothetical protein
MDQGDQRVEALQDSGIKLTSVASQAYSKSADLSGEQRLWWKAEEPADPARAESGCAKH